MVNIRTYLLVLCLAYFAIGAFQKLQVGSNTLLYSGENIFLYNFMDNNTNMTFTSSTTEKVTPEVSNDYYEKVRSSLGYKKVVIFYDSAINVIGRGYFIELARAVINRALHLDFTYLENVSDANVEELSEKYISNGVELIFLTSNTQTRFRYTALKNPNVTFLTPTANNIPPFIAANKLKNVYVVDFVPGTIQGRYIAGIMAGLSSKTGHACYINNFNAAYQTTYVNAFYLGMVTVNPNAQLHVYNTRSFDNITVDLKSLEYCLHSYPQSDVITTQTNNLNVFQEACKRGMKAINQGNDVRPFLGECIVGTIIQDWNTIINLGLQFRPWNYNPETYYYNFTMANNGVKFLYDSTETTLENKDRIQAEIEKMSATNFVLACSDGAMNLSLQLGYSNKSCLNATLLSTKLISPNITFLNFIYVPPVKYVQMFVDYNSDLGIVIIVVASAVIVLQLAVLGYTINKRREPLFQKAVYPVLISVCVGNIIGTASLYFLIGFPNSFTCNAHALLCMLGFTMIYSCILLKTFRVSLYASNVGSEVHIITNQKLMVLAGGLMLLDIIIFIGMAILSPFKSKEVKSQLAGPYEHFFFCVSDYDYIFLIVVLSLNGLKMLILFYLSNSIKLEAAKSYKDTSAIKYSSFLLVVIFVFTVFIYAVATPTPMMKALFIFIVTILIVGTSSISIFYTLIKKVFNSSQSQSSYKGGTSVKSKGGSTKY